MPGEKRRRNGGEGEGVGIWLLLVVVVADGGQPLAYCHSPLTGQITSEHCLAGQVQNPLTAPTITTTPPPSADACVHVRTQDRKRHTQSGSVCVCVCVCDWVMAGPHAMGQGVEIVSQASLLAAPTLDVRKEKHLINGDRSGRSR